jgi:clan AA aspartic protease (TIGR02281 family)
MMRKIWALPLILLSMSLPATAEEWKIPLVPGTLEANTELDLGSNSFPFLVDTGASSTTISQETFQKLDIPENQVRYTTVRSADGRTTAVPVVTLANVKLGPFTIPQISARVVSERGANLLGMDVLGRYRLTLEAARNQLVVENPNEAASIDAQTNFPYNPRQFKIPVQVKLNGTPVSLILDTGATQTVISNRLAQALQLPIIGQSQAEVASGKVVTTSIAKVSSFQLGDLSVSNFSISVIQDGIFAGDGLLGFDFLRKYRLVLDPIARRAYLGN